MTGEPGELIQRLIGHMTATGLTVEYDATIAPSQGQCIITAVKLLPGQTAANEFSTLIHEYAHALLHQGERRAKTTKTTRETEAEAVAFIVATASGMNCGHAAADYIQMYDGNTATLIESLQHVQAAASEILTALEGGPA